MTSPNHREDLSALIDGALGRSESSFLLRRLEHDAELRESYACWHMIGDCLRGGRSMMPAPDSLAGRIREAIADEAVPRRRLPLQVGLRWAAGFATAAVVAASAFWYVQPDSSGAGSAEAGQLVAGESEVTRSGVRADDLRRQLPLLPVSSRSSRPVGAGEFAPTPDPETWQRAPVTSLHYPSTQYIIVLPAAAGQAPPAAQERPASPR